LQHLKIDSFYQMAKKGTQKNSANKAKHTKLLKRKKDKLRAEKDANKERLKAIIQAAKKKQEEGS
jgi:ElaB/YqjD/DUF883 family membrane-anchored ribosome-binding protein